MGVLSSVQNRGRLKLHRVQYLYHCLADSLQRIPVNMVHRIVDGVPGRSEGTLPAVGIIRNDVYSRDAAVLVYGDMVVGNHSAYGIGKVSAETGGFGCIPDAVDNIGSELQRHPLAVELGTFAAYHVQENAEFGLDTRRKVLRIVLCSQCP